jgi:hypothetical protein
VLTCTPLARADDARDDMAAEHHKKALELYDAGDTALALVEFERAYAANGNYKALFNIGEIHFQLGHYAKAREALEKFLAEGGNAIPEARRASVDQDLAKLRLRTATLTVKVTPADASVHVNEQPFDSRRTLVDAGTLRVRVEKEGFTPVTRELVLAGGEEQDLAVSLRAVTAPAPAPAPARAVSETPPGLPPLATAGWITSGVLLAGTVGVGIGTLVTSSNYDDARERQITTSPTEARRDLDHQRSTVKALALTTDILGAATLVAGGLSLYLTLRPRSPRTANVQVQGLGGRLEVPF